ncbi:MAG: hypothetical protein GY716_09620 [bacterium]|nr:hypothetical protein [bacterium]
MQTEPTRELYEASIVRSLKVGGPTKADLNIADLGDGPVVVKDYRAKAWWVRVIGRLQIRRETLAYRRLGPLEGIPAFVGRIDAIALAIEYVPGVQLGWDPERKQRGTRLYPQLCEIVRAMHERGMVHWDLRTRDNVLATDDDRVYVLDLASAMWLRPGGLAHRLLSPWMQLIDRSALLKWKNLLAAGPYTDEEQAFVDRYRFWRSLWIFNPKRGKKNQKAPGERDESGAK